MNGGTKKGIRDKWQNQTRFAAANTVNPRFTVP